MIRRLFASTVIVIVATLLFACKNQDDKTTYYIAVWKDCKSHLINFYEKIESIETEYISLVQPAYPYPGLEGVLRVTHTYKATPLYPAVDCGANSVVEGAIKSSGDFRELENSLRLVMDHLGVEIFDIAVRNGKFQIYFKE